MTKKYETNKLSHAKNFQHLEIKEGTYTKAIVDNYAAYKKELQAMDIKLFDQVLFQRDSKLLLDAAL